MHEPIAPTGHRGQCLRKRHAPLSAGDQAVVFQQFRHFPRDTLVRLPAAFHGTERPVQPTGNTAIRCSMQTKGTTRIRRCVLPNLVCPSDQIAQNPIVSATGNWTYALGSYGGNGGTRSYFPSSSTADGVFFTTGPASEPTLNQTAVGPEDITDGLSHTLLFGERSHYDPNYHVVQCRGLGRVCSTSGAGGRLPRTAR